MSYDNRVDGEILIDPPLRWSEIRDSRYSDLAMERSGSNPSDLVFVISENVEETDSGMIITKETSGIRARLECGNNYDLLADLRDIVRTFAEPGRTFSGWLVYHGDPGCGVDVRRYGVEVTAPGGLPTAVEEKATLRWPDGEEIELPD